MDKSYKIELIPVSDEPGYWHWVIMETSGNGWCNAGSGIGKDYMEAASMAEKEYGRITEEQGPVDDGTDMYHCVNDGVFCKCRACALNEANGGKCAHCICCIDGNRAMDLCMAYRKHRIH